MLIIGSLHGYIPIANYTQRHHHTVFVVKQLVLYSRMRVCMCVCAHVHICRELTKKPHVAGNISDIDVALLVYDCWKGYNFDKLELTNYTVLLQYPGNYTQPNLLQLQDSAGTVIYDAHIQQEKPLLPEEEDASVAPPFNAYSGMGNATVRDIELHI